MEQVYETVEHLTVCLISRQRRAAGKCGQCPVDSRGTRLNTDYLLLFDVHFLFLLQRLILLPDNRKGIQIAKTCYSHLFMLSCVGPLKTWSKMLVKKVIVCE